jgi:hypothetical protein
VGAVRAPTIQRSYPCKRSQQLDSTSPRGRSDGSRSILDLNSMSSGAAQPWALNEKPRHESRGAVMHATSYRDKATAIKLNQQS